MDERLRRIADYLVSRSHSGEVSLAAIGGATLPNLYVLDIERDAAGEPSGFKIRFMGTGLDTAFARRLTGRKLGDFIHGPRGAAVMEGFQTCARERSGIWMRQIVHIKDDLPRFVEGLAVYLEPERIYGVLLMGKLADRSLRSSFEIAHLPGARSAAA